MKERTVCPKCGFEQPFTQSCMNCGVIISKFQDRRKRAEILPEIERRLEKSLNGYFTTTAREDEQAALVRFRQAKKRLWIQLLVSVCVSLSGFAVLYYSKSAAAVYAGFFLLLAGVGGGIVGSYLLYRCPVCGMSLLGGLNDPDEVGYHTGVRIYPPPAACPNCNTPLK